MHVRLVPFHEIFVSVTLDLDEATELADALELVKARSKLSATADKLRGRLEEHLGRAMEYKKRRGS